MKTAPLQAAELAWDHPDHPGTPWSPMYGDVYHAEAGAVAQARQVFLGGNGLPQRWQQRARFVVLETGFGLGNNFLATWSAWREDPRRCGQLVYLAIEKHPLRRADLQRVHAAAEQPELAAALVAQWPALTPDLHTLEFDHGRVRLLLALGDVAIWPAELVAQVDAFYLDGFAPARNPAMWDPRLFRSIGRLAAAGATAATWSVARAVRDGLTTAGFEVLRKPGLGSKRDRIEARLPAPEQARPRLPAPPGRQAHPRPRSALVIGAGLAGAAAARALAAQGLSVQVLERRAQVASETSGNPAGLFHGVVHPNDGAHAQLLRAAARRAQQLLAPLTAEAAVPGAVSGLLRGASDDDGAMQDLLARQALPPDFVQRLPREQAEALAGVTLTSDPWFYPGGGWVSPPALVQAWLSTPGVTVRTHQAVERLVRDDADRWQARDACDEVIGEADLVVLACAHELPRLLAPWTEVDLWPLQRRRGQITVLPPALVASAGLPRPSRPLASGGYLLSLPPALGGGLLCGATSQIDDDEGAVRAQDHDRNLRQITELTGAAVSLRPQELALLSGRVGWRLSCDDRLPVVGPVPLSRSQMAGLQRLEQPRQVPRQSGLYVLSALGSRGITLAPLLGEVLAAWITGAPVPLPASLLDAIDPARFVSRQFRRAESTRR